MNKTKTWLRCLIKPTVVVFAISIALVIINLYLAQRTRPYTSDDVSWQNILTTWTPFNGHIADMGSKDNFLVNVPILMLFGHIFQANRTLLFLEASVFAIINFSLFYVAGLYMLKKCRINISYETLLPFLWLASLGYNFSQLFLNMAWRDFEMGISFVYFAMAVKFYYGEVNPLKNWISRTLAIVAGIVAGLFIYSDPYFLYLTVGPVALLFVILYLVKKATKGQALLIAGSTMLSLVVSLAMKSVDARIGLFSPLGATISLIHFGHLASEFTSTVGEMTTIFGVNIAGARLLSMSGIASILNLIIVLAVAAWFVLFVARHRKRHIDIEGDQISPLFLVSTFFGALYILVFVACYLDSEDDYRYFVLSAYLAAILVSFIVGKLKRSSTIFIVILWLAICINLATSVFALTPMQLNAIRSGNKANAANYALIERIKQLGLRKGYANYWNGNINTYLSDGSVNILPVTCINDKTVFLRLLVDTNQFQTPSNNSFYINDPSQTSPVMCSLQEVEGQFGRPAEVVSYQKKTILIYNYDIAIKMQ